MSIDLETAISLVAGSMNSGKSMLLQNVGLLRARRGHHVHSFESPIERLVEGIFQYEVTEQNDWLDWSRFATRNDPGDIIFGEINDRDTAQRILGFANGKLVLTTLHTNRAVRFTERLRNLLRGESERDGHAQIAAFVSTTGYVYCQRLLPRVCPTAQLSKRYRSLCARHCSGKSDYGGGPVPAAAGAPAAAKDRCWAIWPTASPHRGYLCTGFG